MIPEKIRVAVYLGCDSRAQFNTIGTLTQKQIERQLAYPLYSIMIVGRGDLSLPHDMSMSIGTLSIHISRTVMSRLCRKNGL